jgi:hypothetical protein
MQMCGERPAASGRIADTERRRTGEGTSAALEHQHDASWTDIERAIEAEEIGLIEQRHHNSGKGAVGIREAPRNRD